MNNNNYPNPWIGIVFPASAALVISGLIGSAIVIGLGLLLGSAFVLQEYGLSWTLHAIGEMLR